MLKHAMYGRDVAKELVDITYYHLRMHTRPDYCKSIGLNHQEFSFFDNSDYDFVHCRGMTPDFFLYLYNKIGKEWEWFYANEWSRNELEKFVYEHEFYTLNFFYDPIGLCVYDRLKHLNIAYFGLLDHAVGKGIGKRFLKTCVNRAWRWNPDTVWLYTTSKDHPRALPTYKSAGFVIERVEHRQEYFPLKD